MRKAEQAKRLVVSIHGQDNSAGFIKHGGQPLRDLSRICRMAQFGEQKRDNLGVCGACVA